MVNAPQFDNLSAMDSSTWQTQISQSMINNIWPPECIRCEQTETISNSSIRLNAIEFHKQQTQEDYLTVGGVLDNICNSACLTCNEDHSTKIGSLISKQYKIVDNTNRFWDLPQDRIVHLDLNGGEPSASKNYKQVLANLPKNVKSIRVNTNGSIVIEELEGIVARGIEVIVTISLDGIGEVHDYVRWPIKWDKFYANLLKYHSMNLTQLNTWTTVSALNLKDLNNILTFVKENNILHSYALLSQPEVLNVKYKNSLTEGAIFPKELTDHVAVDRCNQDELDAYLKKENKLRNL
jgi:sulfatase maturation enzyme AslB (radical SAM superfamily)